jgi:hypothetical protein
MLEFRGKSPSRLQQRAIPKSWDNVYETKKDLKGGESAPWHEKG